VLSDLPPKNIAQRRNGMASLPTVECRNDASADLGDDRPAEIASPLTASDQIATHVTESSECIVEPTLIQPVSLGCLPPELALEVLRYLRRIDLYAVMLVSSRWRALANDNSVWKIKCDEMDIQIPSDLRGEIGGWKRAYVRHMRVEENWQKGRIQRIVSKAFNQVYSSHIYRSRPIQISEVSH
jgi:hypothetical protein